MHDFTTIHNFKNYLRWEPDRANQIGYGYRPLIVESRNSNVRLSVKCGDDETAFENADKFVEFLKANPAIAEQLQFRG